MTTNSDRVISRPEWPTRTELLRVWKSSPSQLSTSVSAPRRPVLPPLQTDVHERAAIAGGRQARLSAWWANSIMAKFVHISMSHTHVLIEAIPLCYSIFTKYCIQSQHNINIQSIIHSYGYIFRFHQTFFRPILIIRRYIQCVPTLWDPIPFTSIKAKITTVFNNFISKLMYF